MLKALGTLLIFCLLHGQGFGYDLKPVHLKLRLIPRQQQVGAQEVVRLDLSIKCISGEQPRSIILPNSKESGLKMIYLSFYTVDQNNHYTRVFIEKRQLSMSRSDISPIWHHNLSKGDSLEVPLFYRDSVNYARQVEAHHQWPQLPPGRYKVLAHYNPWNEEQAENVYHKIAAVKTGQAPVQASRFNIPEEGLTSNYIDLWVKKDGSLEFGSAQNPESCRTDCGLCAAVEKGEWRKVRKLINNDSTAPFGEQGYYFPHSFHRGVAYLYPGPDVILSSLPGWYGRRVIFKNEEGYHYFNIGWQVGKIYPLRSRVNYLLQNLGLNYSGKTEDLDYFEIVGFERE